MARNSEKAMALLNRWYQMKHSIISKSTIRYRPRHAEASDNIKECEYWRHQIMHNITRKIAEIQNASLGEHRIRQLNDEINDLLKKRAKWEDRIKELRGPDYRAASMRAIEAMSSELVISARDGYKYFGAAKNLPDVRKLFEEEAQEKLHRQTRTKQQLYRNINPSYYGWRDEENPDLLLEEKEYELKLLQSV